METKFTSIVITYNSEAHLEECLGTLRFADEKIVIDMGSTDRTLLIARSNHFSVINEPRVEIVEQLRARAVAKARNNWILLIDPDEIFSSNAIGIINENINKYPNLAAIGILLQNYYCGVKIKHGFWRPYYHNGKVFDRRRVIFSFDVHEGIKIQPGYIQANLDNKYIIKHYWVDSFDHFFEKHKRYLKFEGKRRFRKGEHYNFILMTRSIIYYIYNNYIKEKGFLDFKNGLLLLKLGVWYERKSWQALKRLEH